MVNDMRWSYSRLASFEHCKYNFYLGYIVKDDEQYLSESNYYAEVGSYVHEILAMIFNGELDIEDASEYYAEHFDENVSYRTKQNVMDKTYEACADYFATVDFDWLKDYEILGVELETKLKIFGYDFIGYIDLLLKNKETSDLWLIDHKSGSYMLQKNGKPYAKSKENFETYSKQMYLYCHAVKELFGEFPKQFSWNHFKDGGRLCTIPFDEKEYNKSLEWFKDTIIQAENERDFEPTQSFFYCGNLCNFRNSCEYRKMGE